MAHPDDAYYWAITGRIPFDDEDTPFVSDLPCARQEAIDAFVDSLWEGQQETEDRRRDNTIITSTFYSTEPIFLE